MSKIAALILAVAIAAPGSHAFAANSRPMSQSYNAVAKGATMTQKRDVRKMQRKERAEKARKGM